MVALPFTVATAIAHHHHVFIDSWQNATAQGTGVHIYKLCFKYNKNTIKRVMLAV